MDEKQIRHFFNNVMVALGYHGWTLRVGERGDAYCWEGSRTIDVPLDYEGDPRQILLHEVAHVGTARFCNQAHNPAFWKRLEYLTRRFLGTGLDERQSAHKGWTSGGFYRACYDRRKDA